MGVNRCPFMCSDSFAVGGAKRRSILPAPRTSDNQLEWRQCHRSWLQEESLPYEVRIWHRRSPFDDPGQNQLSRRNSAPTELVFLLSWAPTTYINARSLTSSVFARGSAPTDPNDDCAEGVGHRLARDCGTRIDRTRPPPASRCAAPHRRSLGRRASRV